MRWPWQPRPGTMWISSKRLIALQQNALRAIELEREGCELRAESRALALINEQCRQHDIGPAQFDRLLKDLPQDSDGLHESAFRALLDRRVWECQMEADLAAPAEGNA